MMYERLNTTLFAKLTIHTIEKVKNFKQGQYCTKAIN